MADVSNRGRYLAGCRCDQCKRATGPTQQESHGCRAPVDYGATAASIAAAAGRGDAGQ